MIRFRLHPHVLSFSLGLFGALVGSLVGSVTYAAGPRAGVEQTAEDKENQKPKLLPVTSLGFRDRPDAGGYGELCPRVRIEKRDEFTFTDMETRLLCGDKEGGQIGQPWADIPANQAAFFLRGFLQTRGYHRPEFYLDNEILFVKTGELSRLTRFRIVGGPEGWDPPKRRLIDGALLTPALLDDLQGWTIGQVKDEGYPCAQATVRGDPATGETLVRLDPGDLMKIIKVESVGDIDIWESALDRYNAFRIGDLYRERLVTLTKRRVIADGFLQTLSMSTRCTPAGAIITRDVVLGPSRTIRIGAGGSTELGPRVRASASQSRIGASASSAKLTIDASRLNDQINQQTADARFRFYYAPGEPRNYVEPSVSFRHVAENATETAVTRVDLFHGWNHEYPRGQFDIRTGPVFLDSNPVRGFQTERITIGYAEARLRWTNHDFEYFNTSPRDGEQIELGMKFTGKKVGAEFTAQQFQLQGQKLWSILRFDPPLFILGVRYNLTSVFSGDPNISTNLPAEFLTLIGGERDLRGFERGSLPRTQVGALSAATGSVEGRFHKVIFKRADFFTFLDAGALGAANFKLETPIFMSPGFGVRWESPIGVLRAYAARRFAVREAENQEPYGSAWRIGVTFGEEF
jgi:outer membrane translocation and assembly module TamA